MMRGKKTIRITPAASDGEFIASFQADVLGATFAVIFPENLTGAVALHRFTRMIEAEYGTGVKIEIDDSLFPLKSKAVQDLLQSLTHPLPLAG